MNERVVVLDAMGVLYRHADDVADLLVPYVRARGCAMDTTDIEEVYRRCSLGEFDTGSLWRRLGVAGSAADSEYCELHELSDGIVDLLEEVTEAGCPTACLSNDVSAWSVLLRKRFGLDRWVGTWVISGAIGVRKPDPRAYQLLLAELGVGPDAVLFADDRPRNVAAAEALGIHGVLVESVDGLTRSVREWI